MQGFRGQAAVECYLPVGIDEYHLPQRAMYDAGEPVVPDTGRRDYRRLCPRKMVYHDM